MHELYTWITYIYIMYNIYIYVRCIYILYVCVLIIHSIQYTYTSMFLLPAEECIIPIWFDVGRSLPRTKNSSLTTKNQKFRKETLRWYGTPQCRLGNWGRKFYVRFPAYNCHFGTLSHHCLGSREPLLDVEQDNGLPLRTGGLVIPVASCSWHSGPILRIAVSVRGQRFIHIRKPLANGSHLKWFFGTFTYRSFKLHVKMLTSQT